MDITPELIKLMANGGLSVMVFVIWVFTFKELKSQNKVHRSHVEKLYQMIEQDLKYKELLTGILTRLETKLDVKINYRSYNE